MRGMRGLTLSQTHLGLSRLPSWSTVAPASLAMALVPTALASANNTACPIITARSCMSFLTNQAANRTLTSSAAAMAR
jgi:hypothetical protein